jgi:glycosyltransferase involved in cell wall biosynthesis
MTRDLYVSTFAPIMGSGRAMRTYTCVRALAMLGPLDLAYIPYDGDDPAPEYQAIEGLRFHRIVPTRGLRRASVYLSKRAQGIPDDCCRGVSPELIHEAERLANQPGRGRVVVDGTNAVTALLPLARRRPVIYNSHNLFSTSLNDERRGSRRVQEAYERRLLRTVAESWMVSRLDMQAASSIVPSAGLRYMPNAVDVGAIKPVSAHQSTHRILMVADFTYRPNQAGREFLVDEVMPLVWSELPEARLMLVGRGSDGWVSPDGRVEIMGFVDDLAGVYSRSDCVVVPVKSGGGSPLKFIEALAYQVPVVATPFAARGLEMTSNEHYLEGADGTSFASALLTVLRSGAPGVAARGRRLAEAEYSVQALAERLTAPLEHSRSGQHPPRP